MNNNKTFSPSGYIAEDIARINSIDLSDPNSIARINSIDNTISELNSHTIGYVEVSPDTGSPTRIIHNGKILLNKTYGRVRWIFVQNQSDVKVERVLQQEVVSEYMGEPTVTEWVTVPIENI